MRKFKFKSGDMVSFNFYGEKHIGKVISGGEYVVYMDAYILQYYYSIYDLSNGDMFCVGEEEIKLAPEQDIVECWTKAFFRGYNPFQEKAGGDDESNR